MMTMMMMIFVIMITDDDDDNASKPVVWKYPNSLQVWYVHGRALLDALYSEDKT